MPTTIEDVILRLTVDNRKANEALDNTGKRTNTLQGIANRASSALKNALASAALIEGARRLTQHVFEVTQEFVKLRGEVERVTNESGKNLDRLTAGVDAIAKTFDSDFNQVLGTANALSIQFGLSFDDSIKLIEEGFLSGANASGDFLSNVSEYAVQFNNAGFSAQEFIRINAQQTRDGFVTDKLLDSIKEADLSLKEFTKTQQDALNVLGEEFATKLAEDIASGSVTTKDALFQIVQQSKDVGLNLTQLQTITADVFKGAGEDAGGFGRVVEATFEAVNSETSDYIDTTNALVRSQQIQLQLTRRLSDAQSELAGSTGFLLTDINSVGTALEIILFEQLSRTSNAVSELTGNVNTLLEPLGQLGRQVGILGEGEGLDSLISSDAIQNILTYTNGIGILTEQLRGFGIIQGLVGESTEDLTDEQKRNLEVIEQHRQAAKDANEESRRINEANRTSITTIDSLTKELKSLEDQRGKINVADTAALANNERLIVGLRNRIDGLKIQKQEVEDNVTGLDLLNKELDELNAKLTASTSADDQLSIIERIVGKEEEVRAAEVQIRNLRNLFDEDLQDAISLSEGNIAPIDLLPESLIPQSRDVLDGINQQRTESETAALNNARENGAKFLEDRKKEEEEFTEFLASQEEERNRLAGEAFNNGLSLVNQLFEARQAVIENEINLQRDRVNTIRSGEEDATADQLALEQGRLEELESQREKSQERQAALNKAATQAQIILNTAQTISNIQVAASAAAAQSGVTAPVVVPIVLAVLGGLLASAANLFTPPSFFVGTADTGNGNGQHVSDGKGGFTAILHPNEGVVPANINKPLLAAGSSAIDPMLPQYVATGIDVIKNGNSLPVLNSGLFISDNNSKVLQSMESELKKSNEELRQVKREMRNNKVEFGITSKGLRGAVSGSMKAKFKSDKLIK